jgi:hypothetical protein
MNDFKIEEAVEMLERTPKTMETYLLGLSEDWLNCNEGANTWTPKQVIAHLVYGEKYDWIPRVEIIINHGTEKTFAPFDREAHLQYANEQSLSNILNEFKLLRSENIKKLKQLIKHLDHLEQKGIHPVFGEVSLQQLLSTWVAHDLTHIIQISRTMAKRYEKEVGPWTEYLSVYK